MLGALGLVTVFAFALCWVFTALAMVVREPRSVQGLGALVMLPLTFGSNVFVPTATLPGWLQGFVEVNPVSKVADAARGLLTGGAVAGPGHRVAAGHRRAGRGVRAAGGRPVPAADLIVIDP